MEIGDGIKTIPENCFSNNINLQWISFGQNISTIQQGAFDGCAQLKYLECKSLVPPFFSNALEMSSVNKFDATLYIPQGKTSAYEQANVWKDFLFKEEKDIPEYVYTLPKNNESGGTGSSLTINGALTGTIINQINANPTIEMLDLKNASVELDDKSECYSTGTRIEDPYTRGNEVGVIRNAPYYSYKYYTASSPSTFTDKEYSSAGRLINVITMCFSSDLTNAHLNKSLKCIKLPYSLTSLGENVISGDNLVDLYVYSTTPPVATSASFGKTNKSTCVLHVPAGCKETYCNATGWCDFNNFKFREFLTRHFVFV